MCSKSQPTLISFSLSLTHTHAHFDSLSIRNLPCPLPHQTDPCCCPSWRVPLAWHAWRPSTSCVWRASRAPRCTRAPCSRDGTCGASSSPCSGTPGCRGRSAPPATQLEEFLRIRTDFFYPPPPCVIKVSEIFTLTSNNLIGHGKCSKFNFLYYFLTYNTQVKYFPLISGHPVYMCSNYKIIFVFLYK